MRFSLKQLEYFVAAAEAGSIKDAAERIHISQPSISSAVTHLERELQLQLFVRRHAQGLSLTMPGKRILHEARLVLKQANGFYALAGELRDEISGKLNVGCMVTLAPMIMPELSSTFTDACPAVDFDIVEGTHEQLLERLGRVDIEAAICYDLNFPDDIAFEPLTYLSPQVVVAADHALADRESLQLTDLVDQPMILLDLPYSTQYFYSLFEHAGLTAHIVARSSSLNVVRSMVANGEAYTISNIRPRNMTTLDGRKLKAIKLAGEHKPMTIGLATLRQDRKPMVLRAFEQHCRGLITDTSIPGMSLG